MGHNDNDRVHTGSGQSPYRHRTESVPAGVTPTLTKCIPVQDRVCTGTGHIDTDHVHTGTGHTHTDQVHTGTGHTETDRVHIGTGHNDTDRVHTARVITTLTESIRHGS